MSPSSPCPAAAPDRASNWLDGFAVTASSLCMIHCLALPLLVALMPVLATQIDPGESFHLLMLGLALPTSLFALTQGFKRQQARLPLLAGVGGLLLMATGALLAPGAALETGLTVAGGALLAAAHLMNWRQRRRRHAPPCLAARS